ncbi:cytochrome oxidase c assembly-domain-containing protein [Lasiosphaeria hispida]|uniref:Cytochrome oxidase c assembly-domain-containing protein n=1 Tax=Lasiosphaeria hispida TaxID=260671 RepID=A0AAJ0MCH0_9PEZI|nr:cytochrome oxidase c assembly-domain-containing protein [Lasiosphaeria hispida]
MPITTAPRSVKDATRFTPTTPHANSKLPEPRFTRPGNDSSRTNASPPGGKPPSGDSKPSKNGPDGFYETPDQRVARLRAAHRRATEAKVSRLDKVVSGGRRFFDTAHKVTVMGLVGFSVLAAVVTVYTAADMMMYNKKRKAEFFEAQRRLEDNSLEAARLAYMTGKATEEQTALVEEVLEREGDSGQHTSSVFGRLPSALSTPKPLDDGSAAVQRVTEAANWPTPAASTSPADQTQTAETPKSAGGGLWSWLTSSLKKEEGGDDFMTSQRRLGYESLSEEDDSAGVRDSDLVRAVEEKQAFVRSKAHEAFEKEKENQRHGGPLDRLGLEAEGAEQKEVAPKKKGWFW